MKKVSVREWSDLTKKERDRAREEVVSGLVECEIDLLSLDLDRGMISEDDYYRALGCSKRYAETTAWFIPSCYYDAHRTDIDREAKEILRQSSFNSFGSMLNL